MTSIHEVYARHRKAEALSNVIEPAFAVFGEPLIELLMANEPLWISATVVANALLEPGERQFNPPSEETKRMVIDMLRARQTAREKQLVRS